MNARLRSVVEVEGLGVAFDQVAGRRQILDGVEFSVAPGECVAIIGPNGAGKTVLTNTLLGRFNGAPGVHLRGEVHIGGESLFSLSADALRRLRAQQVSAIFQDFSHTLNPIRSVGGQLRQMQRLNGAASDVHDALRQVNFPVESAGDRPHQLSQGMKQRALMAMALANRPKLVVADEITSALDVINQQIVFELLMAERRRRPEMAILFVCHSPRLVALYADRVLVLDSGRIVEERRPGDEALAPSAPRRAAEPSQTDPDRTLLDARGIVKRFRAPFRRPRTVLRGVDLRIRVGEHTALVGASGSGKTTLASLVTGVLPVDPGDIERFTFDGESLLGIDRPDHPLRHRIQMVFQDPDTAIGSIDPRLTVEQVILEPRLAREPGAESAGRAWVAEKLETFGLAHLAHRRAAQLSGGQRQRVEILRAFHGLRTDRPALMVADEPTSMLDPEFVDEVVGIFAVLAEEYPVTYLFITHSLELMRALCSRVAVMFDGELVEQAPVAALTEAPLHPYSRLLLRAGRSTRQTGGDPEIRRYALPSDPQGCPAHRWCQSRTARCEAHRPRMRNEGTRQVACHHPSSLISIGGTA